MGKIKRGNCIFLSWTGDHGHHVPVYRGGKRIVKWDLDSGKAMKGKASRTIRSLIDELQKEGRL